MACLQIAFLLKPHDRIIQSLCLWQMKFLSNRQSRWECCFCIFRRLFEFLPLNEAVLCSFRGMFLHSHPSRICHSPSSPRKARFCIEWGGLRMLCIRCSTECSRIFLSPVGQEPFCLRSSLPSDSTFLQIPWHPF